MDTLLHWVFWNAILATLLGFVAAGSVLLRRPALTHALWTLVLLKLITPAFIPLPIPGYFASRGPMRTTRRAQERNPRSRRWTP